MHTKRVTSFGTRVRFLAPSQRRLVRYWRPRKEQASQLQPLTNLLPLPPLHPPKPARSKAEPAPSLANNANAPQGTMRSLTRCLAVAALLVSVLSTGSATQSCAICVQDHLGAPRAIDLAGLPSGPFGLRDGTGRRVVLTPPCRPRGSSGDKCAPASAQHAGVRSDGCVALGGNAALSGQPLSWVDPAAGVFLVQRAQSRDSACPAGVRTLVVRGQCDATADARQGPDELVVENPTCTFTVSWRHKAFCSRPAESSSCSAAVPTPTPDQLAWQVRASGPLGAAYEGRLALRVRAWQRAAGAVPGQGSSPC